ncbi:MAG TPA: M15 family metallopeptidase [Acidobacteriaceae bacterium]|jgi:hypothetical protein|nr:M15 family metallopeptidase [Acidobacteriaceae bacterium]
MISLHAFRFCPLAASALLLCFGATAPAARTPNVVPLSPAQRAAMTGKSWKPGCPVSLDDLDSIRVIYYGFDSRTHQGTLIVHKRFADEAAQIFDELYKARFPINKIEPWGNYGPDVYAEQDITVGFYCERADDAPTEWSGHAYGVAIDLNPRENPFRDVKKGWWPKTSAVFAPRDGGKGKISPNTAAFRIFARHGWAWGGFYVGEPDLMHFYKFTIGGPGDPLQRPYVVTGLKYIPGGAFEASQPQ